MVTTRLFDISCFLIHLAARLNSILHAVPSHSKHIGYLCKHNLLAMQGSSLAVASAHRENLAIRSDVWVYQCADNCTESIVVYGAARPLRVLRDSFFTVLLTSSVRKMFAFFIKRTDSISCHTAHSA